jgi:hypothetical protein
MKVTQAGVTVLKPTFVVQSTAAAPKTDTCDVTAGQKVKCNFDASGSTPASSIASYAFAIDETKEKLGAASANAKLTEPTLATCNLFNIIKGSNGAFPVTVRLTVTSNDGKPAADFTHTVSFQKNGAC